jgi:hypothetical protein
MGTNDEAALPGFSTVFFVVLAMSLLLLFST